VGGQPAYATTWGGLKALHASEGVSGGLFKGLQLTFLKGPLQSAIGYAVNDECKRWLRERHT